MSLMKSDRTKAPKSDRIAEYAITLVCLCLLVVGCVCLSSRRLAKPVRPGSRDGGKMWYFNTRLTLHAECNGAEWWICCES